MLGAAQLKARIKSSRGDVRTIPRVSQGGQQTAAQALLDRHKYNGRLDNLTDMAVVGGTAECSVGPMSAAKVRVVLTDARGRVLLGRTQDGACNWGLPGGAIDPVDADVLAAAEREVAEETGARGCSEWRVAFFDQTRRTSVCAAVVGGDAIASLDPSLDPDQEFSELRFFEAADVAAMATGIWDDAKEYVAAVTSLGPSHESLSEEDLRSLVCMDGALPEQAGAADYSLASCLGSTDALQRPVRPVLALDLDGTILDAVNRARGGSRRPESQCAPPDFRTADCDVRLRPGLMEFLSTVTDHFVLAIWTAAPREHAEQMLGGIQELYREKVGKELDVACVMTETDTEIIWRGYRKPIKDIRKLALKMQIPVSRCMIVDDTPCTYSHNTSHALPVPKFTGRHDSVLSLLQQFLIGMITGETAGCVLDLRGWKYAPNGAEPLEYFADAAPVEIAQNEEEVDLC